MGGRVIPQGGRSILNDDVRVLVTERDGAVDLIFILRPEVPEGLLDLVAGRRFTIGADWPIHDGSESKLLPTRPCMTSNFTSTASAGALR